MMVIHVLEMMVESYEKGRWGVGTLIFLVFLGALVIEVVRFL